MNYLQLKNFVITESPSTDIKGALPSIFFERSWRLIKTLMAKIWKQKVTWQKLFACCWYVPLTVACPSNCCKNIFVEFKGILAFFQFTIMPKNKHFIVRTFFRKSFPSFFVFFYIWTIPNFFTLNPYCPNNILLEFKGILAFFSFTPMKNLYMFEK